MDYTPLIDLGSVDLSAVLNEVLALIPVVLPVTIGFIAFRKGYSFIKSVLKGA
ncbi:MAG TPA: hypothetical protein GX692_07615 [Acholeplasmataceae bacterium]|nr:hypothetical protein [Acholeplasmataceae bacterium]